MPLNKETKPNQFYTSVNQKFTILHGYTKFGSREIHAFSKGISSKWNANNLVQDLKSESPILFLTSFC